jgi:hypothetical protein
LCLLASVDDSKTRQREDENRVSSLLAFSGYAATISSLPYTIKKSGTYTLDANLTYSGAAAINTITVKASNVVIDLGGFTLSGTGVSSDQIAIFCQGPTNITVQNGTITGFYLGVELNSSSADLVQNLRVLNGAYAVYFGNTVSSTIQNCFILNAGIGIGVYLVSAQGIVMKNNQVTSAAYGCGTTLSQGNSFIANQLVSCNTTRLALGAGDKYQANVTIGCPTPFDGGTAVGYENN